MFCLEETSKIIKSYHQPKTTTAVETCLKVTQATHHASFWGQRLVQCKPLLVSSSSSAVSTKTSLDSECCIIPAITCTGGHHNRAHAGIRLLTLWCCTRLSCRTAQPQWIANCEAQEAVGSVGLESTSLWALGGVTSGAVLRSSHRLPHQR